MRTLAFLATLTFVAMAFAGCSDGGDDGDGTTTSTSASRSSTSATATSTSRSSSSSSSASSTSGAPSNAAPSGSISASINGTNATFSLNGTDPDGDALSWELDFGDGSTPATGDTLPATSSHPYAIGNHTANFTLSDGTASKSYEVAVAVAGGSAAGPFVFAGDVEQDCATPCELGTPVGSPPVPLPGSKGCLGFKADMQGLDCLWTPLGPELADLPFTLVSTAGDPDLEFLDTCDPVEGASLGTAYNAGPEAGFVPAGAGCAVLWEFNAAPSTITFTVG